MKFKFLGTGTSQGIPVIGCHCEVCTSTDLRNRRFRSSGLITTDAGKKILIDCGPDFRMQMLENKEDSIDAVLLTHEHNDHVIGLDDLRPLIFRNKKDMALYSNKRVGDEVRYRFPYAFTAEKYPISILQYMGSQFGDHRYCAYQRSVFNSYMMFFECFAEIALR